MTALTVTAFGAQLASPARTAALLRATASRATDLFAPAETDLVAAVLLADAVLVLAGSASLEQVPDPVLRQVLFAALARAAGAGRPAGTDEDVAGALDVAAGVDLPAPLLARLEAMAAWACQWATPQELSRTLVADVGPALGERPDLAALCALLDARTEPSS